MWNSMQWPTYGLHAGGLPIPGSECNSWATKLTTVGAVDLLLLQHAGLSTDGSMSRNLWRGAGGVQRLMKGAENVNQTPHTVLCVEHLKQSSTCCRFRLLLPSQMYNGENRKSPFYHHKSITGKTETGHFTITKV